MSLRTRLERLEARLAPAAPGCPGCGWGGRLVYVQEQVDASTGAVRLVDDEGRELPGLPTGPACAVCRHQISCIVIGCVTRGQREGSAAP